MSEGPHLSPDVKLVPVTDSTRYREELQKVTRDFEGILMAKMFQTMRSTVSKSDLFGDEYERKIYEDMLFSEFTKLSARAESIGIAEMLLQSFLREDTSSVSEVNESSGNGGESTKRGF